MTNNSLHQITADIKSGSGFIRVSLLSVLITASGCGGAVGPEAVGDVSAQSTNCGRLTANQSLAKGQSVSSCFGWYKLIMQTDGNLVLYAEPSNRALWATGTYKTGGYVTKMQSDGNLVVYNSAGGALWSSRTNGQPGAYTAVQDDGNMVVYNASKAHWASNTAQPPRVKHAPQGQKSYTGYHTAKNYNSGGKICSLNSNSGYVGLNYHWPAWSDDFYDIFGNLVGQSNLADQSATLSCYIDNAGGCAIGVQGYSSPSNCWQNFGWSCTCGNTGLVWGITNATASANTETSCAANVTGGSLGVNFTVAGNGGGVTVAWNDSGSVIDYNGGDYVDTCSWH